ncbi:DUF3325 family protein [Acetobacter persici]|uniref:DUF3325 family protein n=1 Tax=Acetobacter persici TaxID=1076596 RepID=UPI0036DB5622
MTVADSYGTVLQFCAVFMLSLHRAWVRWAGGVLLAASLCLDIMTAENVGFTLVFWICALAFAVIATALLHTVRRQWVQRRGGVL